MLKSSLTYSSIFTSPPFVGAVDTVVSTLSITNPFTGVEGGSAGVTLMLTGLPTAAAATPASGLTRRKRLETRSRNARKPLLGSPLPLLAFRLAMLLDLRKGKYVSTRTRSVRKFAELLFQAEDHSLDPDNCLFQPHLPGQECPLVRHYNLWRGVLHSLLGEHPEKLGVRFFHEGRQVESCTAVRGRDRRIGAAPKEELGYSAASIESGL